MAVVNGRIERHHRIASHRVAFFSCQGLPPGGLRRIILTASGGAFRDWDVSDLDTVRVEDAIKHPNWSMG